jgi:hypothetical protein
MDGGGADVALIEREARHVAQEAITRLKESQRRCFNASAGIPSWTGASGHIRIARLVTFMVLINIILMHTALWYSG